MKKIIAIVASFMVPALALAQVNFTSSPTAVSIVLQIKTIFNYLIPILITLGVIYFIYGVITYVISKGEEAKVEGRNRMIYGIIGLFVIISIWGLVGVLGNTFGISQTAGHSLDSTQLPSIQ